MALGSVAQCWDQRVEIEFPTTTDAQIHTYARAPFKNFFSRGKKLISPVHSY